MIWRLAYRNIWRNRRRTLITVVSVAGGLMFSLLLTGIQDGGYDRMIDSSARIGTGHLTFENKKYRNDPDSKHSIVDYRDYLQLLEQLPDQDGIDGYSLRIVGQGMLASSYGSVGTYFDALAVPSAGVENRNLSPIAERIVAGSYLSSGAANGVVLGDVLARKLKVGVGSKIVLTINDRNNQTIQELLQVVGLFHVGADAMDGFYFQMPLPWAQKVLGFAPHEVVQIALFLKSQRQTNSYLKKLSRQLAGDSQVTVYPWYKVLEDLANYIAMDNAFNYILQCLAFLVIAAGILNTVLMSVMERRFEFGLMLAMGTAPHHLFRMIVLESALIGVIGLFLGSLLGWGLNIYFAWHPIDLARFMNDNITISGFAMEPIMRTGLYWEHYLTTCVVVFCLVLCISLYPASKAARTIPVQAIAGHG